MLLRGVIQYTHQINGSEALEKVEIFIPFKHVMQYLLFTLLAYSKSHLSS